jgi:hypothetical protein
MLVTDLVAELSALWPFANDRQMGNWAQQYRRVLAGYEGLPLRNAFDDLMAEWTKNARPLPGDFVARLKISQAVPTKSAKTGINHRARSARAQELRQQLVAEWMQARSPWMREAERSLPEADRIFFRFHIERAVGQKAWLAALKLADDPDSGACVSLSDEEVRQCIGRVRSQPRQDRASQRGLRPLAQAVDRLRDRVAGTG